MLLMFSTLIVGCSKEDFEDVDSTGLPTPKANEIYYTTTNGNFLDLSSKEWFNTTVTSHTVKNDSIFVLTFIKDLEEVPFQMFAYYKNLKSIRLPNNIKRIRWGSFESCSNLINVNIPEGVKVIDSDTFAGCRSLTSITIPQSVETIPNMVFSGCSNLTSFKGKFASDDNRCLIINNKLVAFACGGIRNYTIPDNVTEISNGALASSGITNITIPESVTTIGFYAFFNCDNLKSITIPKNVTMIKNGAFYGCSSLESVYFQPKKCPEFKKYEYNTDNYRWEDFDDWCLFDNNAENRVIYVPTNSSGYFGTVLRKYSESIVLYDFD